MISNIPAISGLQSLVPLPAPVEAAPAAEGGFVDALAAAVDRVDQRQVEADQSLYSLATGEGTDLHSTMIALEEANIALRTMATTRDRLVEAYQQVWNMQI